MFSRRRRNPPPTNIFCWLKFWTKNLKSEKKDKQKDLEFSEQSSASSTCTDTNGGRTPNGQHHYYSQKSEGSVKISKVTLAVLLLLATPSFLKLQNNTKESKKFSSQRPRDMGYLHFFKQPKLPPDLKLKPLVGWSLSLSLSLFNQTTQRRKFLRKKWHRICKERESGGVFRGRKWLPWLLLLKIGALRAKKKEWEKN